MQISHFDAAPLARPSHAMFGLLLAEEEGVSVERLAERVGLGADRLRVLMGKARAGELPKFSLPEGPTVVVARNERFGSGSVPGHREEVLVKRWMRRICRHLAKHGSIDLAGVIENIGEGCNENAWQSMEMLRARLVQLRIFLQKPGGPRKPIWLLDDENQQLLADIVAANWRVAG